MKTPSASEHIRVIVSIVRTGVDAVCVAVGELNDLLVVERRERRLLGRDHGSLWPSHIVTPVVTHVPMQAPIATAAMNFHFVMWSSLFAVSFLETV